MAERKQKQNPENERPETKKLYDSAELPIQEVADTLGISRQFLIHLLEQGEIKINYVGATQYFRVDDLIYSRNRKDVNRMQAIDELIRMSEELGLYNKEVDFPQR